jgi:hypothetical protein
LDGLITSLESGNVALNAIAHVLKQFPKPLEIQQNEVENLVQFEAMKSLLIEELPLHPDIGTHRFVFFL